MNSIFYVLFLIFISISHSADLSFLSNSLIKYKPWHYIDDTPSPTPEWLLEPVTAKILSPSNSETKKKRHKNDFMARRQAKSSSGEYSSTMDESDMKKEWQDVHWAKKKVEVLNLTTPPGHVVNMVAARPWGVRCGDPSLHDMPWGTCMLPMECDVELRIMKGDFFCGRSPFVCCAIVDDTYDLNKGFDESFASLGEIADKEEENEREKKRKAAKDKQRRKLERYRRKKKIKSTIKKIIQEFQKILNRMYSNATRDKKKKTRQMKKFIQSLKNQYKKDRQAMKDVHEVEMLIIDAKLRERLEEIRLTHNNFMKNDTFKEIIENGTISINGARMLLEAYPDLEQYFVRPLPNGRRNMNKRNDYLDYDVEYGLLYY